MQEVQKDFQKSWHVRQESDGEIQPVRVGTLFEKSPKPIGANQEQDKGSLL